MDASLLDIELGVDVLGLPISPASPATRSTSILSSDIREIASTREDVDTHQVARFGPGLPLELPDLIEEPRTATADLLSLVHSDPAAAAPACSRPLSCVLNGAAQLLSSLLGTLQQVTQKVRTNTAPEGAELTSILSDLIGLGVAEAQLEVLSVECQGRPAI